MSVPLADLVWAQAFSGAPIYVLGMTAQGLWLHSRADFRPGAIAACLIFSTFLVIMAGLILWVWFFAGGGVMLWQVVNLPALIASILLYPFVALVVAFGFGD